VAGFDAARGNFRSLSISSAHNWFLSALLVGGVGAAVIAVWLYVRLLRFAAVDGESIGPVVFGYLAALFIIAGFESAMPFNFANYALVLQGVVFANAKWRRSKAALPKVRLTPSISCAAAAGLDLSMARRGRPRTT
jgi:hypothetical protein